MSTIARWIDGDTSPVARDKLNAAITAIEGRALTVHGHAIGDTTGLQVALDGKAASVHTHVIGDTTGLQGALDGKAAISHTHAIAHVTDLQAALDARNLRLVPGSVLVPPTGAATNQPWMDAAGGLWVHRGDSWRQVSPGQCLPAEVAAVEALAPPLNYLLRVSGEADPWHWTVHSRWASIDPVQYFNPVMPTTFAITTQNGRPMMLDDRFDWLLERIQCSWVAAAGTWDASNRWEVQLRVLTPDGGDAFIFGAIININASGMGQAQVAPTSAHIFTQGLGRINADFRYVEVGAAGDLTVRSAGAVLRRVRRL